MADISKITVGGQTYNIKDTTARQAVAGGMHFIGTTSTAITDGSTTTTLTAATTGSLTKTTGFVAGDVVIYNKKEFVWTGTQWAEFGDITTLGAMATADSASGTLSMTNTAHKHQYSIYHIHNLPALSLEGTATAKVSGSISLSAKTGSDFGWFTSNAGGYIPVSSDFGFESIYGVNAANTSTTVVTGVSGSLTTGTAYNASKLVTAGSTPTYSAVTIPTMTDKGTMFAASVNASTETLVLTAGSAPTAGSVSVNSLTGVGSMPTFSDVTIQNITGVNFSKSTANISYATVSGEKSVITSINEPAEIGDANYATELKDTIAASLASNVAASIDLSKVTTKRANTTEDFVNTGSLTKYTDTPVILSNGSYISATQDVKITLSPDKKS